METARLIILNASVSLLSQIGFLSLVLVAVFLLPSCFKEGYEVVNRLTGTGSMQCTSRSLAHGSDCVNIISATMNRTHLEILTRLLVLEQDQ
jgi:hypothetical protein